MNEYVYWHRRNVIVYYIIMCAAGRVDPQQDIYVDNYTYCISELCALCTCVTPYRFPSFNVLRPLVDHGQVMGFYYSIVSYFFLFS